MIFLDTHVFVWLYAGMREKFSDHAIKLLDNHDIKISPVVMLETQYLYEIKRITCSAQQLYEDLHLRLGITIDSHDFISVTHHALTLTWTRDSFDRLIVANTIAASGLLLTADNIILKNCSIATWG